MTGRVWRALLLAAAMMPAAHGQFELFLVEGNAELPAPPVYDFGSLYTGESASARFRLRNTSAAPAALNVLAVAGAGFTLDGPALPLTLDPQKAADFTVSFGAADTGTYSAALRSEGISVLLTVTVLPRLTYQPLGAGPVDFGTVVRGSSVVRHFTIENQTALILTVPAIAVQGSDFALSGPAPSGAVLQPHQTSGFDVRFTPTVAGARGGSLVIGDRTYGLTGTGADPPLPKPQLVIDLQPQASAQQGVITVRFAAPAQTSGSGTVTMDGPADPAMGFASGVRTATFTFSPGDTQAAMPFQTGTTAGTLTFTVQLGGATDRQTVTIPAAPVGIAATQAARSPGSIEVRVTGFDNTRTVGALTFTFYDAAGSPVVPGTIRADATADFARYFQTSDLGGVFLLRALFPVTGDASGINAFEVQLTNSAGTAKTARTAF